MRISSYCSLLAAVSLAVAGCAATRPAEDAPKDTLSTTAYVSETEGFRYLIPESWRGRAFRVHALHDAEAEAAFYKARHIVEFSYYPENASLPPQVMVAFLVMTRNDWEAVTAEGGPPPGELLAERGGTVFVLSLPQSNPYPPDSKDARTFDEMNQSLDQVQEAFSLR